MPRFPFWRKGSLLEKVLEKCRQEFFLGQVRGGSPEVHGAQEF